MITFAPALLKMSMRPILQFGIIFVFLAVGEFVVKCTIGMLLLALSLRLGIVRLEWVDRISAFLVHNLGFFFVPAGVGLMKCLGLLADQWIPIVGASVGSTVVIIAVTGWVHQLVRRSMSRRQRRSVGI